LFNRITLEQCPGLAILLDGDEKIEDLMKLSPEAILLRWVNHQLEQAGAPKRINNFTSDISDSEAYTHLLYQIAPLELGVTKEALMESDHLSSAEIMLQQADKLGCRSFISPKDVVEGIYKLNLAFVANLFNNHPGLDSSNIDLEEYANVEESREEKSKPLSHLSKQLYIFIFSTVCLVPYFSQTRLPKLFGFFKRFF
jgi:plastin-3